LIRCSPKKKSTRQENSVRASNKINRQDAKKKERKKKCRGTPPQSRLFSFLCFSLSVLGVLGVLPVPSARAAEPQGDNGRETFLEKWDSLAGHGILVMEGEFPPYRFYW
jgi:hypothetical protein